jgi:Mg-chelatase subunit ChlI
LKTVLDFDQALSQEEQGETSHYLEQARKKTWERKEALEAAKRRLPQVEIPDAIIDVCATLTETLMVEGHRADYLLALAARAHAARAGGVVTTREDVQAVAELVLRHRIADSTGQAGGLSWNAEYEQQVAKIVG